jgi:CheY-like chemotaxis protein
MDVAQYLFLGAQELKERAGEEGLYFVEAGLNWVLLIMGVGLVACFGMVWKRRRTYSYCQAMQEEDADQRAQKDFMTNAFHNTRVDATDCRSACIIWDDLHTSSQIETRSHRVRTVKSKNSRMSEDSSSPPRRILLVEDTELNRIILGKVLQTLNLHCEEAENGKVAVDYFKQGRTYDLVLMDKEMPVMDGHEATRQLRSMGVKTPIVALTGNTLQSDKDLFFEAGVDDFQIKPLSKDRLVQLLARYGVEGCAGNRRG